MAQDWQVIAFTQREKLVKYPHELGLFDGSPSKLVLPLTVPVLRFDLTKSSDVTSSGLIGNHKPGRAEDLRKSDRLPPEEQKEDPVSLNFPSIKPKRDSSPELTEREQKRRNSILEDFKVLPAKSTCGLLRLPNELLDMIYQIFTIEDVFVLGLQSQRLWNVARRHIYACCAPSCGPWAGKGIICVGEFLEPTDYPNVLTESERKELQKEMNEVDDLEKDEPFHSPTNLHYLADTRYQQVRTWQSSRVDSLIHHATSSLPPYRRSQTWHEFGGYYIKRDSYPVDQPWILRNLTTQEYVRSEAIAIKPEYIHGPKIDGLGFGEVVWSRICWSGDADYAVDCTDNIYRGVWAGHCFDITTLERHKQSSLEGMEWKDISEEVANSVDRIWRNHFGSNWRDMIQKQVTESHNYPFAKRTDRE